MEKENANEKRKYIELFEDVDYIYRNSRDVRGYGCVNNASEVYSVVRDMEISSICDVGCGNGAFCVWASEFCDSVYGVDIASVATNKIIEHSRVKYFDAEAKSLPLPDNSVEYITSFDCLEHCLEKDIDDILKEFSRVATDGFIFSIAYRQAGEKSNRGEDLHMTVKPEAWWIEKISKYAKFEKGYLAGQGIGGGHKYLVFKIGK